MINETWLDNSFRISQGYKVFQANYNDFESTGRFQLKSRQANQKHGVMILCKQYLSPEIYSNDLTTSKFLSI